MVPETCEGRGVRARVVEVVKPEGWETRPRKLTRQAKRQKRFFHGKSGRRRISSRAAPVEVEVAQLERRLLTDRHLAIVEDVPLPLDLDVRDVVTARGVAAHVRHNPEELVFARPVLALAGRLGVPGCRRGTSRLARRGVNLGNRGVEVVGAGEEPVRRALDVPVASGARR